MNLRLGGRHVAAIVIAATIAAVATVVVSSTRSEVHANAAGDRVEDVRETPVTPATVAAPVSRVTSTSKSPATTSRVTTPNPCPWNVPGLAVATRVNMLVRAMTPLEEATLLHLRQYDPAVGFEGYTPAIPRLCIPMITEQDGAAGVATGMPGVTQLPAPISDAAAFDPSLAGRYGDVIGAEDAAKGVDLALSPTINIDRSPLWGRSYETLGEDPYLTASLAVPIVEGIQSNRVVAVVKHFAVYNQETARSTAADDAIVSDRALHEVYLPAFEAVTRKAKAGAMMCSYNLVNGTPACESASLIDGILRGQWGFDGFVRSDCNSVYQQAPAMAVGVSQVKCTPLYNPTALAAEVAARRLSRATLDGLARPLLSVLFRYNLIASPHPPARALVVASAAHEQVARQTADEGAVLLKNAPVSRSVGPVLPLDLTHLASLALIGPTDGTPMPAGFGAMYVKATHPVSALAALRQVMGARVRYEPGTAVAAATALARTSQVAVVVVHDVEAERHDRSTLALPPAQDALVKAVAAVNPRTIVVLETGSAVLMPWRDSVPAILETWYPGETAGQSLVDLLSGNANPSGKLPVTFPASQTGMPAGTPATFGGIGGRTLYREGLNVGYRWYEANGVTPAFSFGYGLSYTTFAFSGLQISSRPGGGTLVSATITNTGRVRGADVVQCYLGHPPGDAESSRQLRAFERVDLLPGHSQAVQLTLSPGDLAVWNSSAGAWVVSGGTYPLWVGDGSDMANLPLSGSVRVAASRLGAASGPATST